MITLLDNLTILEHQNLIRFLNGRQSVGNDKTGPTLHECLHSFLNQELQPCIDKIKILGLAKRALAIVSNCF